MRNKLLWITLFLLILSIFFNLYIYSTTSKLKNNTFYDKEVLLKINDEVILTREELKELIFDKYEKIATKNILNDELIRLSAKKFNIPEMTETSIEFLMSHFDNYLVDNTNLKQIQEFYYIYNIYDIVCNLDDDIKDFFNSQPSDEPTLYSIAHFASQDHGLLMSISDDLKRGKSIDDISNIQLEIVYEPSLNNYEITEEEFFGEPVHYNLGDHNMIIAYLLGKEVYSLENKDIFKNYYFQNKYLSIKPQVTNLLHNYFEIKYN